MRSRLRVLALTRIAGFCPSILALIVACPAFALGQPPADDPSSLPDSFRRLLVSRFALTPLELKALQRGDPFVKLLNGSDAAELAALGILRLDATPEAILDGLRRTALPPSSGVDFRQAPISEPPVPADFRNVTLAPDVIAALPACRPGSCVLKIPAADMDLLRNRVSWKMPDAAAQANALFRDLLLRCLQVYRELGGGALPLIDDKEEPVNPEKEFRALLGRSLLGDLDVELAAHIAGFPESPPAGVESVFLWSRKKIGPRYVVGLWHRLLHSGRDPEGWSVVATRQIYANHFFRAALEVVVIVPCADGGAYLLRTDRARVDPLTGVARLGQGKLREAVRGGLTAELEAVRSKLSAAH